MWDALREGLYPWKGTMPVVEVSGEPRRMGLLYGRACSPIVKMIAESFIDGLASLVGMSVADVTTEAMKYEQAILARTGRRYIDEMEGIAEGAGVKYEQILALNCGWDLLNSLPTPETHPYYMCSSFAAWGRRTEDAGLICGHNDDGARFIDQFLVLLVARPSDGNAFVTPIVPGYLGYHRMWNEKGCVVLGLSLERGCPDDNFAHNLPWWIRFRHLIQTASSSAEIVQLAGEIPAATPMNLIAVDAQSGGVLLHETANRSVEIQPDKDSLVCTNHAIDDAIKPYLILAEHPSGTDYRYETVRRLVNEHTGRITHEVAKAIQTSHIDASEGRDKPGACSPCAHYEYVGKHAGTVSTVALEVTEAAVRANVSLGNPCEGRWIEHELPMAT